MNVLRMIGADKRTGRTPIAAMGTTATAREMVSDPDLSLTDFVQ